MRGKRAKAERKAGVRTKSKRVQRPMVMAPKPFDHAAERRSRHHRDDAETAE